MSDQEKFILLCKKLHPKFYSDMRNDRHYKRRTETFEELKLAVLEKTEEDWLERQLFQPKRENVHALQEQVTPNSSGQPQPGKGKGKGQGKGAGKGKGVRFQQTTPPQPLNHRNSKPPLSASGAVEKGTTITSVGTNILIRDRRISRHSRKQTKRSSQKARKTQWKIHQAKQLLKT